MPRSGRSSAEVFGGPGGGLRRLDWAQWGLPSGYAKIAIENGHL